MDPPTPTSPRLSSETVSSHSDADADAADADVTRAPSAHRSIEADGALSRDARDELRRHARELQENLLSIFNRIESVRLEYSKLDSNNRFLQKYIGDLMSTSKITASGAGGSKGKK